MPKVIPPNTMRKELLQLLYTLASVPLKWSLVKVSQKDQEAK